MNKRRTSRFLSIVLLVAMVLTLMPTTAFAEDSSATTWTQTTLEEITTEDTIAITMNVGGTYLVLPTSGAGSKGQPLATETGTVNGTELSTEASASELGWTVSQVEGGYAIANADGKQLYVTAANNGVRIGSASVGAVWNLTEDSAYLTATDSNGAARYLGIYSSDDGPQDWRCYTNTTGNIAGQSVGFWKLNGAAPEPTEPPAVTISPISDALAASSGEFTVKGVVTFVEGRNVYVQDETGAICLYLTEAGDVSLGDTVIGTGNKTVYKGLPELSAATFEKSEGMALSAKTTTIGALTNADICTYVHIEKLTVTAVSGSNIDVQDDEGNSIQIFRAVLGEKSFAVEDVINFTGAVGMFNNLQLRNTVADEITAYEEAPEAPAAPTADVAEGTVEAGTVVTFATETEGAVIYFSVDNGETWTEGNTYTVNETVTIQVKAVKDEISSEIVSFTYTVEKEEPASTPISEVLAASEGSFTVKGVVTLLDGKNVYVQDATGGICLYLSAAPTDLALGDTVIGTGSRTTYKGLPELGSATYEKSSGLTLSAKTTTLDAIGTADLCTYVHIENLTVTAISGNNTTVQDANGNSLVIFKAVAPRTLAVDDVINFTGAVGIYNNIQLRNTLASEIEILGEPAETVAAPTADVAEGTVEAGTVVTFSTETEGAVIYFSVDNGETWTEGNTYTVNETVTIQVKAVKDEISSEIVSFTYTVGAEEPETTPIGDVLAASSGSFTVKGVVTMLDGKNVYVQDATGGICLYLSAAPTDLALGDTVIGAGSRTTYNDLPELGSATYEKSSGLTLSAKKTTIGALSTADICTYVKIDSLTITAINGRNIDVQDDEGNSIQIFKSVTGDAAYAVGDVINFTGAVGIYKGTLQLRNTLASEIGLKPEAKLGLVTDLADLTDGAYVVIYNPGNSKAMSSEVIRDDWYLAAADASVAEDQIVEPAAETVWKVSVSDDGVYTFTQGDKAVTGWLSGTYQELTSNASHDGAATGWKLETLNADTHTFYLYNATLASFYIEVYGKKVDGVSTLVFCGYKKGTDEKAYGMQFYLVEEPEEPTPQPGDGLPVSGQQYVAYCAAAEGVMGLPNEMNNGLTLVAATITDGKASAENGALVFTVTQEGEDYTFECGGKYLATNDAEELFLQDTQDGYSKWYLTKNGDGYVIYNRTAKYNGTPVCIEFFSGSFSGWTFKSSDAAIFRFNFYPLADDMNTLDGVVNNARVIFTNSFQPVKQQEYLFTFTLDDLTPAEKIRSVVVTLNGERVTNLMNDGKSYSFVINEEITAVEESLNVVVTVNYVDGGFYTGECSLPVQDIPAFLDLTPTPGSQTGDDLMPLISARVLNASDTDQADLTINGENHPVPITDGVISYQPTEPLKEGRTTVKLSVLRADGVQGEISWSFTVGYAVERLYFGQLHSHTTYSDGSGSLEAALEYVASIPESANIQFVAFTDHSNYFDSTGAANPEAALYDVSQMTAASTELWNRYRSTVADFNASQTDIVAIAGFEMTWSGGPGHINTFNSPGIVSRNNSTLNNKTNDAGMKAYYATLDNPALVDSLSQFNHPGKTFGNFVDFSYWDAVTDTRMYLVEVGNGEGQIGAGGYYPSYEQYIMALDKGWHVAPTNNQDNHKGKWGNANDARDVILTDDFSETGLYNAIRQYRVYATEDKNLEIYYSVNDMPLGTSFAEVPEELNFSVSVYDPDASDSIIKVELVANSGTVVYTWTDPVLISAGLLEVTLAPDYNYYFVRVTEADGDLAVTAPVWVGESLKLGISAFECGTSTPVTGEEFILTTTFFNSEASAAVIKSVTYTVNGSEVIGFSEEEGSIPASSTTSLEFKYTPVKAKIMTITVTAVVELDGKEYTFKKDIELEVKDADSLVYIGIDASHFNEYVAGNYKDSMGNFSALAAGYGVRTVELKTSEDLIAACSNEKFVGIIFTAPSRRLAAAQTDPKTYSEDELAAIAAFNAAGGMVIVCGWGDAYENYSAITDNPAIKHMAETQNELLAALGCSIRLGDDEVVDPELNGGQEQRLYFSTYNFDSFLLEGVEVDETKPNDRLYTEVYSNYGGCSVYFTESGIPGTVTPIVFGHTSTNIANKDNDANPQGTKYPYADGDERVVVLASEQLGGKGLVIVSGAAFMSNFEVQATVEDTAAEKNYSNYKICENLVKGFNEITVTPIAEVQAQTEIGLVYTIEGTVTSNASGYDKDTAFFDCIYVQDETAGICCFPVSGNYKIGDVVRITGYTDFYQAEMELQVRSIQKIGETDPVEPKEVTSAQINDLSVLGSLVTLKGTVVSFEYENDLIQTILVKDAEGNIARVFIDGYITTTEDVKDLSVGCRIEATGLSSYDDTWKDPTYFPRIRVRNRADIICTTPEQPVGAVVVGKSLALEGKIAIRFYLELPDFVLEDENAYVMIGEEKLPVSSASSALLDGKTLYIFSTKVKFAQLTEERVLRVYSGNDELTPLTDLTGADLTETGFIYRAQDYIETIRADGSDEELLALVNALSDVGSLAQLQFNYNTETRVEVQGDLDSVTAESLEDYALTVDNKSGMGISYVGSSLLLVENTTVRHYFSVTGGSISQFTFKVDGKTVQPVKKGSYYYIEISNIVAKDLNKFHHVEVSTAASGVVISLDYCALSYVYKQLNVGTDETLLNLVKAIALYSQAADAFFEKP